MSAIEAAQQFKGDEHVGWGTRGADRKRSEIEALLRALADRHVAASPSLQVGDGSHPMAMLSPIARSDQRSGSSGPGRRREGGGGGGGYPITHAYGANSANWTDVDGDGSPSRRERGRQTNTRDMRVWW